MEEVETAKYPWGPIEFTLSQGNVPKINETFHIETLRNLQFYHFGDFAVFGSNMFFGNHAHK